MHESRVRKVVQSPLGLSVRISLRIQITLRCSLRWGAGHRAVFPAVRESSAFSAHLLVTGVLVTTERQVFAHGSPPATVEANEVDDSVDRLLYRLVAAGAFHGVFCRLIHRVLLQWIPKAPGRPGASVNLVVHRDPLLASVAGSNRMSC